MDLGPPPKFSCWPCSSLPLPRGQTHSGWEQLGKTLGSSSENAYEQGYLEGLQRETDRLNREADQSEAELRAHVEQVRAALTMTWEKAGFSQYDAEALAAAYELTIAERAVVAGVRRKGSVQAGPDIRAALDANNYLLANQLLLGVLIVAREEQQAATHADGRSPTP